MSLGLSFQKNDVPKKIRMKDRVVSSRVVKKRCWARRIIQLIKKPSCLQYCDHSKMRLEMNLLSYSKLHMSRNLESQRESQVASELFTIQEITNKGEQDNSHCHAFRFTFILDVLDSQLWINYEPVFDQTE